MYDRYMSHGYSIFVSSIYPPIPDRNHDYNAFFECFGEEGPNGFGKDPEAAIHDLWMAASAGDWFDEAFWDEWDLQETRAIVKTREEAAAEAAEERSRITLRSLFGHAWLMGEEEYPG